MSRPRAVLVGPPGAGKTVVGERLAERWGCDFRDTDGDIEAMAGKSIAEIFVDDGEQLFRRTETGAVRAGLAEATGVLALGGGAVMDAGTRDRLVGHRVVFLDVGLTDAVARVGLGVSRPLVFGNVRAQLKALLDARRPLYAQVATVVVPTDGRAIDEVVAAVDEALESVDA